MITSPPVIFYNWCYINLPVKDIKATVFTTHTRIVRLMAYAVSLGNSVFNEDNN